MNDLEKINSELNIQITKFEKENGEITEFFVKQLFESLHNMNLEDVFFNPELSELEKYEKFLNGGN